MIYIAIAIVICFISFLVFKYINPYVDSIEKSWNILRVKDLTEIGITILYKRTYKNGKVKFFKKSYDNINK